MPIVDEGDEVFFDSVNILSPQESLVEGKSLGYCDLGYEIWLREPQSVKERRETFLRKLGFADSPSFTALEEMDLKRVTESSRAVSSTCALSSCIKVEGLECERSELNGEANCSVEDSDRDWFDDMSVDSQREINESHMEVQACLDDCSYADKKKKKMIQWWKRFTQTMMKNRHTDLSQGPKLATDSRNGTRVKMVANKKRCMECTAVYVGQEIHAHNGLIWTMKFSPDGKYLASGGEDGVVCIWRVSTVEVYSSTSECKFGGHHVKKGSHPSVVIPERIFHIEETPLHKFSAHASDVLDLTWSTTNHLLSSSMDKTVRLWRVGSDECLGVFQHNNYVTCVQFDPTDENYFMSGSIDGKVRIFGVSSRRVVHWANVGDVVTAICYQPNGRGFVVGCLSGNCRFYETLGDEVELKAEINIQGRKKSSDNKITGIQFLKGDPQRLMITSEDSKIRILDGLEVVHKYRGLAKSGSQMSASFISSGRHIVSVGEDSRIYIWNYDDLCIESSKQARSIRSSEHLCFEGVSVALPWSDLTTTEQNSSLLDRQETSSVRFSMAVANWFSGDGSSSRASITWPEEILPSTSWELQSDCQPCGDHLHQQHENHNNHILSETWGLVIVTAGFDGMIRTLNNYGLPVRT